MKVLWIITEEFTVSAEILVSQRRRVWPVELKRQLLAEAAEPGESICSVARRHEIDPAQLYQWRKKFQEEASSRIPTADFLPIEVSNNRSDGEPTEPDGRAEIAFPNGRHLFVPIGLDRELLNTLIAAVAIS